jgi:hypothetical protein
MFFQQAWDVSISLAGVLIRQTWFDAWTVVSWLRISGKARADYGNQCHSSLCVCGPVCVCCQIPFGGWIWKRYHVERFHVKRSWLPRLWYDDSRCWTPCDLARPAFLVKAPTERLVAQSDTGVLMSKNGLAKGCSRHLSGVLAGLCYICHFCWTENVSSDMQHIKVPSGPVRCKVSGASLKLQNCFASRIKRLRPLYRELHPPHAAWVPAPCVCQKWNCHTRGSEAGWLLILAVTLLPQKHLVNSLNWTNHRIEYLIVALKGWTGLAIITSRKHSHPGWHKLGGSCLSWFQASLKSSQDQQNPESCQAPMPKGKLPLGFGPFCICKVLTSLDLFWFNMSQPYTKIKFCRPLMKFLTPWMPAWRLWSSTSTVQVAQMRSKRLIIEQTLYIVQISVQLQSEKTVTWLYIYSYIIFHLIIHIYIYDYINVYMCGGL